MSAAALVLVVDDDDDLRETIGTALEMIGYRVALASRGREALDHLVRGERPALILLDLMMPEMSGFQLRTELEKDGALASIPIVVISAASRPHGRPGLTWARETIPKPFSLDALLEAVQRHAPRPS